jgi:signal transduction histidine kinase/CheY-like chemotaxis protein
MAMDRVTRDLETELRIPPKPVLAALVLFSCALFLGTQMVGSSWALTRRTMPLFLVVSILGLAGWLLSDWRPALGTWFAVLALVITIYLADYWLELPGTLAWAAVPTALAVPLVGLVGGAAVALGQSALVVVLANYPPAGIAASDVVVALVPIWGVLGAMSAAYRPMLKRSRWLDGYFERARRSLDEARDHRADLEQVLDDLAHANRQMALMNERVTALRLMAEEAQKAKTRFVARVSHEFRTPLNMIIGLVDLMVDKPEMYDVRLSPRMREDLQVVHRNCEHLSHMVSDVLDLTRVETDRLALHRERVYIQGLIESAVTAVRPLLEGKGLALEITVSAGLPAIYCDRTRIEQVVLNLLSNAARYTDVGGITASAWQQDHHVCVSVADSGLGIAPDDVERIFEPFSQGTGDLWRDKGGSGLGLAISKQFVELHGGRIWVQSEQGVGTTFTFELPISPPMEPVARPGHQIRGDWVWRERRTRASFSEDHYKPRFVVCDETGDLSAALGPYGDDVEMLIARDLDQAIAALEDGPAHAIVLNLADPDCVWPLVRTARNVMPGTPILGCSVPRRVERAAALGALGHLVKPVGRDDLKRALEATGRPVRRVLVVDDDPDALQLFSRMLWVCDETLEVSTASSGQEALELLRSSTPDLMLLDIVMSDMDGWQVLEAVNRYEDVLRVPTFFVSAQDPADQPPMSSFLLVTIDEGLPISKLLRCSLDVSARLLSPEAEPDPALG